MNAVTKILICDLTHTAQAISSDFMPYGQACVASYLKSHCPYPVDIRIIKFLEELQKEMNRSSPDIIGFSYYMWNANLTAEVAAIIKKKYPDIIVVFGGPNFPVEIERQREWLRKNRQADFFVRLEGERPFCNLVAALIEDDKDLGIVRKREIKGACSYGGKDFFIYPAEERILNLEDIPSPYLGGYLDKYFETSLMPIIETNRGCPFQCAFCSEGYSFFNRIAFRDIDSLKKEFYYIAGKPKKNSMIFIADSNFLMFKRDLEVCKIFRQTQDEYNWPIFIGSSTGKKISDVVLEGAKLLSGKITIAAAVQSLDEEVLKNVNRSNISKSQLISVAEDIQRSGGISYTELIVSLPGDTLKSHFESMKRLVSSGISMIKHHVLLLLEGTSLASRESREKFGFKTRWRVVTKSFGNYEFLGTRFSSMEFEKVVVGTDTLSFDDYLLCRKLGLIIHYFYNDSLFEDIHKLLRYFHIPIWDWLFSIYEDIDSADNSLKGLLDSYLSEVKDELWLSKEELLKDIDKYMPEFLAGKRGNNVTYKHLVLLLKGREYIRDAFEFGFSQLVKILKEKHNVDIEPYRDFFDQLKQVCILKKQDIFDTDIDTAEKFDFDFSQMDKPELSPDIFLKVDGGITIEIAHSEYQKNLLREFFKVHAKENVPDVSFLISRVPAKALYRKLKIKSEIKDIGSLAV